MGKLHVTSVPKKAFSLEAVIQALPTDWLRRLADPSANYAGGAMVRTRPAGGDVAEFRCLLGMLIPGEMDSKALGQHIDKEENPESFELIRILYRTFGPTSWGRIGVEFDALAREKGDAAAGKFVRTTATRELLMREEITHEQRVAAEVEAWKA